MFSVTNTGMNFRPLCTANVCPTRSGRMIDRVHRQAAHRRTPALPAVPAGLADADDLVLGVAELPDGGLALEQDHPDLGRGQADLRVLPFLRHQLPERPGGADHLGAVPLL